MHKPLLPSEHKPSTGNRLCSCCLQAHCCPRAETHVAHREQAPVKEQHHAQHREHQAEGRQAQPDLCDARGCRFEAARRRRGAGGASSTAARGGKQRDARRCARRRARVAAPRPACSHSLRWSLSHESIMELLRAPTAAGGVEELHSCVSGLPRIVGAGLRCQWLLRRWYVSTAMCWRGAEPCGGGVSDRSAVESVGCPERRSQGASRGRGSTGLA